MLVSIHADFLVYRALHAHVQIRQNHQLLWRSQLGHTLVQQAFTRCRANAGAGFQYCCAVGFLSPAAHTGSARRRALNEGTNLFALDHHVLEVC